MRAVKGDAEKSKTYQWKDEAGSRITPTVYWHTVMRPPETGHVLNTAGHAILMCLSPTFSECVCECV